MTYFLTYHTGKRHYEVFYDAQVICTSPRWSDIIDFLKVQYRQNGRVPFEVQTTNIYDAPILVGLEALMEKMKKRQI